MDSLAGFVYQDQEFGEVRILFNDELLEILMSQSDECIAETRKRIAVVLAPFAHCVVEAIRGDIIAHDIIESLKTNLDVAVDEMLEMREKRNIRRPGG